MNIFVLSTGRCGTETFARACCYMTNYLAAHESHNRWLHPYLGAPYRDLRYPDNHIEVDNRLSWFLAGLQREYGNEAFYVHLLRDRDQVARSLLSRGRRSILYSFAAGVLQYYDDADRLSDQERYEIALQYWDTVNDNIRAFLAGKPKQITMWLHEIKEPFAEFWRAIGAQGDLDSALDEWDIRHNASTVGQYQPWCPAPDEWEIRRRKAVEEIASVVPPGRTLILADEDQWGASRVLAACRRLPFPERDGQYWGLPTDDQAAVRELERLRTRGAEYFVLAWPAFGWMKHYPGFARRLRSFPCLLENDRILVFKL